MKTTNVLVITQWPLRDPLIQVYTYPYLKIIKKTLPPSSKMFLVTHEHANGHLPDDLMRNAINDGIFVIPRRYFKFGMRAIAGWVTTIFALIRIIRTENINVIHCWGTPAGAAGYILSILTGRILVLDSYEPHAEAMVENGTWKRRGLPFVILYLLERLQSRQAHSVIAATNGMREYALMKYDVSFDHFFVKPACVDLHAFRANMIDNSQLRDGLGLTDKIVAVYSGKFGGIYFDVEIFLFFKVAYEHWGDRFRALLLTSNPKEELEGYCKSVGLDFGIVKALFVNHAEMPDYLALADFAITPVKPVPTKKFCTPIKDGEYWAMGLPVVIPENISDDSDIIMSNDIGYVVTRWDRPNIKEAVGYIDRFLQRDRSEYFQRIRDVARKYRSFEVANKVYAEVYGLIKHLA